MVSPMGAAAGGVLSPAKTQQPTPNTQASIRINISCWMILWFRIFPHALRQMLFRQFIPVVNIIDQYFLAYQDNCHLPLYHAATSATTSPYVVYWPHLTSTTEPETTTCTGPQPQSPLELVRFSGSFPHTRHRPKTSERVTSSHQIATDYFLLKTQIGLILSGMPAWARRGLKTRLDSKSSALYGREGSSPSSGTL